MELCGKIDGQRKHIMTMPFKLFGPSFVQLAYKVKEHIDATRCTKLDAIQFRNLELAKSMGT